MGEGEVAFGPGISSICVAGTLPELASGLNFNMLYQKPRWAFGFGGYLLRSRNISASGIQLGARYYLSEEDVAPLIGAGITQGTLSVADARGAGVSYFVDAGVELFHRGTIRFSGYLRLEVPTYQLRIDDAKANSSSPGSKTSCVPVGLHLSVGF